MEATKRLYDNDPYLKEAEAKVLSEQVRGYDGLYEVILDQTIFYPTGGGQPHDTGYINNVAVVDVYKQDGVIHHILESSLNGVEEVRLSLNWERRFDHMQQHTGQHILSRAFEVILDADTVGFHLGEEIVTIDLAIEELSDAARSEVERLANAIVMENNPVHTQQIKAEKLEDRIKAKIPELEDVVRMVEVKGFDNCACAGTHVKATAEVGFIKILGYEKYKQKIRLTFVVGNRAFKVLDAFQRELMNSAALLQTNWADVYANVARVMEERKQLTKELKELRTQLVQYEIDKWKQKARENKGIYFLENIFENREFHELKQIAEGVTQADSYVIVFANATTDKVQFLLQRSDNLNIPMNEALKRGLEVIDGKGGGTPKIAQGGGQKDRMNEAIERIREYIFENLS